MNASATEFSTRRRIPLWGFALLLLAALQFIAIFSRGPDVLLHPTLEVEDGREVFKYFYENRGAGEIFRHKAGYIPFLQM